MRRIILGAVLAAGLVGAGTALAQDWLSLCGKCLSPTIFSKTGIGTANAVALARITEAEARAWCENWQPGNADCAKAQMASSEAKMTFRASADCPAGRITPVDGKTYRLDGVWGAGDVGAGRSRWRDAAGRVVNRDNASGGLAISQQWEVLCPKAAPAASRTPPPRPPPATTQAAATFRVGQAIEAKYGTGWVRGQVVGIRQNTTARGTETQYDVVLDNRKRGTVPARMLRALAQ